VLQALGRAVEALAVYDRVVRSAPGQADVLNDRGNVLRDLDRQDQALASYDRALAIRPDFAEALNNRGNTLLDLGQPYEALASYDRALKLRADYAEALNNRGNALRRLNRPEEALASYDRALALRPAYARAHNNRGGVLHGLKRLEEALASFGRAAALQPDYAEAFYNHGTVLLDLDRLGEALASFDRALALKPDHLQAHNNRGNVLRNLGRDEEALASYARGRALDPGHAGLRLNEAFCRLLSGDLESGWREFESRWDADEALPWLRNFSQPAWRGEEPIAGKTILLHAEQGLGDTIQFCRYAKLVAERGATVLMEVQRALAPLLAGLEGVDRLLVTGEPLPPFDVHCPLLSVPLAFNTGLSTIPAGVPYLRSAPDRVGAWQARLGPRTLPRVGLVWSGSVGHKNDRNRSIPLASFSRALPAGRAQYVSLQKDVREGDRPVLAARTDILHFGNELEDFADTAALVDLMDVVVTVDTSVAHLAGAMGKAVWILVSFILDWRWLRNREDSPWYPTARLFRQPAQGNWAEVLERVDGELRRVLGESAQAQSQITSAP
jgi:tetratricopeptide (TPR) repeat protein